MIQSNKPFAKSLFSVAAQLNEQEREAIATLLNKTLKQYKLRLSPKDINNILSGDGLETIRITKDGQDFLCIELPKYDIERLNAIAQRVEARQQRHSA